jgi:hypothetical protein
MSTKTSIKRIAAVAAVALTLGGFSAVSAHATTPPAVGASSGAVSTTHGAAGYNSTSKATVGTYVVETVTAGSADNVLTITSTGVGSISVAATPASVSTSGGAVTTADSTANSYTVSGSTITWFTGSAPGTVATLFNTGVLTFAVTSAVAGTQTITVKGINSAAITETITWGAAPVVAAANSLVVASGTTNATGTLATVTSDTNLTAPSTAYTDSTQAGASAGLYVDLQDNQNPSQGVTSDKIRVRIVSGPGLLKVASATSAVTGSTVGAVTSFTTDYTAATAGRYASALLYANGQGGTTVVEVSDATAGVVIGTKTFTFYGTTPATITASQNSFVAAAGVKLGSASSTAGSGAITVSTTGTW